MNWLYRAINTRSLVQVLTNRIDTIDGAMLTTFCERDRKQPCVNILINFLKRRHIIMGAENRILNDLDITSTIHLYQHEKVQSALDNNSILFTVS